MTDLTGEKLFSEMKTQQDMVMELFENLISVIQHEERSWVDLKPQKI